MRYYFIFAVTLVTLFLHLKAYANEFIQVEGLVLGYYPSIADGVRVRSNSKGIAFEPGHRCFSKVEVERAGLVSNGVNFESEDRRDIRNKLTGLISYPGVYSTNSQSWIGTSSGLAAAFYRDNLAQEPPASVFQLLFMPMVLSPKPTTVVKTEWSSEAREILARDGWPGLERFCGTHFVESVGEEAFVIYSVRVGFPSAQERARNEKLREEAESGSPLLVLNNVYRMRQRFEYVGPGREVSMDVLQVGGRERDVDSLRELLRDYKVQIESENVPGSTLTRARISCRPEHIEPCQRLAQAFLDFQFRRLNFNGERPAFTPVRFRIAPLTYVKALNQ